MSNQFFENHRIGYFILWPSIILACLALLPFTILVFILIYIFDKPAIDDIENFLDDPVDDVKHTIHGMRLPFGYRFYLPPCLMPGSPVEKWGFVKDE